MTSALTALRPSALAQELFKCSKLQSIRISPCLVKQSLSSIHAIILTVYVAKINPNEECCLQSALIRVNQRFRQRKNQYRCSPKLCTAITSFPRGSMTLTATQACLPAGKGKDSVPLNFSNWSASMTPLRARAILFHN